MSLCPRCGASFSCAMKDEGGNTTCWCTQLPPLSAERLQSLNQETQETKAASCPSCFCPACLKLLSEAVKDTASDTSDTPLN
jgi:hypothetical protein